MIEQYKETNISKKKETTFNKTERALQNLYKYLLKKIKKEDFFKKTLMIEKGIFLGYKNGDKTIAKIRLFDFKETETTAFNINPSLTLLKNQTVYLGYYKDYKNLILLGIAEKRGGKNDWDKKYESRVGESRKNIE